MAWNEIDNEGMDLLNSAIQANPRLRGLKMSSAQLARELPRLNKQQRDELASTIMYGRPFTATGRGWTHFDRMCRMFGEINLGKHDKHAQGLGLNRQQFLDRIAAANHIEPRLRDWMTQRAVPILGANALGAHRAAHDARVEKYQTKPAPRAEDKERRSTADDRNDRRAEIARQIDLHGGMRPSRNLYDPANHDKPGHVGRNADIQKAFAQVGHAEQFGPSTDPHWIDIEVAETAEAAEDALQSYDAEYGE